MRAYLTVDDELIVRDAGSSDALGLWRTLHGVYMARRGLDPGAAPDDPVPATTCLDVIELVNAFEGIAGAIRRGGRGLDDWRHGYVRTFELIARTRDHRATFAYNDVVWLELTRPLAEQLTAGAARSPAWTISL